MTKYPSSTRNFDYLRLESGVTIEDHIEISIELCAGSHFESNIGWVFFCRKSSCPKNHLCVGINAEQFGSIAPQLQESLAASGPQIDYGVGWLKIVLTIVR